MSARLASRCALLSLAALGVFGIIAPGGATASVTLGTSDLSPVSSGAECLAPCTVWPAALPSGQTQAPYDGVVVRWRVRLQYLQASGGSGRVRVLSRNAGQITAVRSGESFPLVQGLNEFVDRVPIAAGQTVGFDMPGINNPDFSTAVEIREAPGAAFGRATPPLTDGVTQAEPSPLAGYEPLFNAVVEPDADHDGFGDESQDLCPTTAGPVDGCTEPSPPALPPASASPASLQSPAPATDRTPPQFLGDVGVHPRRLLPGGGAVFAFGLSEPARVTISLERVLPGRRVGGSCRKETLGNAKLPRCRRFVAAGVLSDQAGGGNNRVPWAGRIHGHPLRPGIYRAVFAAVDAAGNVGGPVNTSFTVRPLPRSPRS